jgi:cytochrome c556
MMLIIPNENLVVLARRAPIMRTILISCWSLILCSITWADEPVQKVEKDKNFWMKQKLSYSQSIFAALAAGDFDSLSDSAEKLITLNKVEEFVKHRNLKYKAQLEIFQFATEELARQAEKKNVEGAALAFHQLTLSCVNCHKLLRDDKP